MNKVGSDIFIWTDFFSSFKKKRIMKNILTVITILCIVGLISSCKKEQVSSPINNDEPITDPVSNTSETMFNVRMTDAPLGVEEVNIDLELVVLFGSDDNQDSISLGTNAGIYNLLDFQNGLDTLIASSMITLDTVKQVRLILGEDNTIKVDGDLYDLKTPSAQQSGLKIKVDVPLDSLSIYNLILDFDADESIHQTGNDKWMLKPVIKVL